MTAPALQRHVGDGPIRPIAASALRRDCWTLAVMVIVTLLLGILQIHRTALLTHDSVLFIRFARQIAGEVAPEANVHHLPRVLAAVQSQDQHPGYSILIWAVHAAGTGLMGGNQVARWALAAQIAALVGGVVLTAGTYLLGRELFNADAGLVGAFVLATAPPFLQMRTDGLSDAGGLACLVMSAWLALRAIRTFQVRDAALAGVAAGVGYWVRPEEVQAGLAAGVMLALLAWKDRRNAAGKQRWKQLFALAFAITLLCLPYMWLKGSVLTKENHAFSSETVRVGLSILPGLQRVTAGITTSRMMLEGWWIFAFNWALNLGYIPFFSLLLGAWTTRKRVRTDHGMQLIWGIVALNSVVLPWVLFKNKGYLDHRHLMPVCVLTAYWCWPGALAPQLLLKRFYHAWPARGVAMGLAGTVCGALAILSFHRPLHAEKVGYREAGKFLEGKISPNGHIIDPEVLAGFYAGLDDRNYWSHGMPPLDADALGKYVRGKGNVEYVVFSDRYLERRGVGRIAETGGGIRLTECWHGKASDDGRDTHEVRVYRVSMN